MTVLSYTIFNKLSFYALYVVAYIIYFITYMLNAPSKSGLNTLCGNYLNYYLRTHIESQFYFLDLFMTTVLSRTTPLRKLNDLSPLSFPIYFESNLYDVYENKINSVLYVKYK